MWVLGESYRVSVKQSGFIKISGNGILEQKTIYLRMLLYQFLRKKGVLATIEKPSGLYFSFGALPNPMGRKISSQFI